MPKIFVLSGPDVGMSFDVGDGAMMGRSAESGVPLRHPSVSRHHAHLELDGGVWWIVDEGSRNGLTVADERVPRAPLSDGDEFELGEVLLRFRLEGAAAASLPAIPAQAPAPAPAAIPPAPAPAAIPPAPVAAEGEIVLEGDWDPMATPAPAAMRPAASDDPDAPGVPRMESARARASAKLAAAGALPKAAAGGRGVLQYNKVEARPGFLGADLGQQPWWIKTAAVVLALVMFALVGWLAFRGTMWMRGEPDEAPPIEEDAGELR